MKSQGGSEGIAPFVLNLGNKLRWVFCFTFRPLYPWERVTEPGRAFWSKKKALCYAGMRTQVGLASSPVTIPTTP